MSPSVMSMTISVAILWLFYVALRRVEHQEPASRSFPAVFVATVTVLAGLYVAVIVLMFLVSWVFRYV